jgi:hypothetical protein
MVREEIGNQLKCGGVRRRRRRVVDDGIKQLIEEVAVVDATGPVDA